MKKLLFLIITMQITLFANHPGVINTGYEIENHVSYLEKKYYYFKIEELNKTQTVTIKLTNLEADLDLYVSMKGKADIRDNDCYSSNGGTTNEKCVLTSTTYLDGTTKVFSIMIYGFKASHYKLEVTTKDGAEQITEISDTPIAGQVEKGEGKPYKFSGKKGETYTTTLSALSADADLRVRVGKKANLHSFDCKSTNGRTKKDECSVTLTKDATVYVHVNGYKAADYKIAVLKGTKNPPITLEKLKEMIANGDDVTKVNTSEITDMSNLFANLHDFNQNIGSWDVSHVTNMKNMFAEAYRFNQDIGNWDVSNVRDMSSMFYSSDFNQNIGKWNVSNVRNMSSMFSFNNHFNQDISNWNVSNVRDMNRMFSVKDSCSQFNQPIEKWDVSKVTNMNWMLPTNKPMCIYEDKNPFKNHDLSVWNVSSVTTHKGFMDHGAKEHNITEPKWNK